MLTTRNVIIAVRVVLAGVFLFSGVAKLFSPHPAAVFLSDVLGLSSSISLALVLILSALEILIALGLLLAFKLEVVSFVASLFLLCALLVGLFYFEEDISCGCFGEFVASNIDGSYLVRNFGLLLLSLILLKHSSPTSSQPTGFTHEQVQ